MQTTFVFSGLHQSWWLNYVVIIAGQSFSAGTTLLPLWNTDTAAEAFWMVAQNALFTGFPPSRLHGNDGMGAGLPHSAQCPLVIAPYLPVPHLTVEPYAYTKPCIYAKTHGYAMLDGLTSQLTPTSAGGVVASGAAKLPSPINGRGEKCALHFWIPACAGKTALKKRPTELSYNPDTLCRRITPTPNSPISPASSINAHSDSVGMGAAPPPPGTPGPP